MKFPECTLNIFSFANGGIRSLDRKNMGRMFYHHATKEQPIHHSYYSSYKLVAFGLHCQIFQP